MRERNLPSGGRHVTRVSKQPKHYRNAKVCHTVKGDCSNKGPGPWLPSVTRETFKPPDSQHRRRIRLAPPSSISAEATSLARAQPGFHHLLGLRGHPAAPCAPLPLWAEQSPSRETVTESLMVTRMAGGGYCPVDVGASLGCTGGPPLGALSLPEPGFFSLRKLKAG